MNPVARAGDPDNTGPNPALVRFPVARDTAYQIVLDGQNAFTSNSGDGTVNVHLEPGNMPLSVPGMDVFTAGRDLEGTYVYGIANNEDFGLDPFEPENLGNRKSTVWWSWRAPSSGRLKLSTEGSFQREGAPLNTTITVFSGRTIQSLTYVAAGADVPHATWSLVEFYAEEGRVYEILMDGQEALTAHRGNVLLHLEFAPQRVPDGSLGSDDFADRGKLSGPIAVGVGFNAANTPEAFEPAHFGKRNKVAWWEWTASHSGPVQMSTEGTEFFSSITVFTGDRFSNLVPVTGADHISRNFAASVQFTAVRGTSHVIAVDGPAALNAHSGNIELNVFQQWQGLFVSNRANAVQLIAFGQAGHRYGIECSGSFSAWKPWDTTRFGKDAILYWEKPYGTGGTELFQLVDR